MNELNPTQSQCWCGKRECCCVHSTSVKTNQQDKKKKAPDWDLGPGSSPCEPAPASSLQGESESDRHSTGQLYWVSRLCSIPAPCTCGRSTCQTFSVVWEPCLDDSHSPGSSALSLQAPHWVKWKPFLQEYLLSIFIFWISYPLIFCLFF